MRRALPPVLWSAAAWLLEVLGPGAGVLAHPDGLPARWSAAPDLVVGDLAAGAAWAVLLWLALGWLAVLGSSASGRVGRTCGRLASRLLPRALRGLLETSLGLSVLLTTAPAALATGPVPVSAVVGTNGTAPLPSLDRSPTGHLQLAPLPAVAPPALAPPAPATPPPPRDPVLGGRLPAGGAEVVVRRGDCLWDVVARALGPGADDEAVAQAWPRWYAANRSVIGADPDLLLPGQRLLAPTGSTRS